MDAAGYGVLAYIDQLATHGALPDKYQKILKQFFLSYHTVALSHRTPSSHFTPLFIRFIEEVVAQIRNPHQFKAYHRQVREPFDYYRFGIDFLTPLIDLKHSTLQGQKNLAQIEHALKLKENIVLLANHQIEADPQVLNLMIEPLFPTIPRNLTFIAGARVIQDPFAIPFSMGCHLLCIYAKKYIDHPQSERHLKQLHNKKTIQTMRRLLDEGGHVIYVAPGGGRDRVGPQGVVELTPFDPKSVELFYLLAQRSRRTIHFYPLALSTHHLLPPPEKEKHELGESRVTHGGAVHLSFGKSIDMDRIPGLESLSNKQQIRTRRATFIYEEVQRAYHNFTPPPGDHSTLFTRGRDH